MNENNTTILSKIEKVDNIINIGNDTYIDFCNFSLDPNKFVLTRENIDNKIVTSKTWASNKYIIYINVHLDTCRVFILISNRYTHLKLSDISIEYGKMNLELFPTINKIINLLEPS